MTDPITPQLNNAADPADAIQDIIDAATYWNSEDADRPDPLPPSWQAVIPLLQSAPKLAGMLRDAQGAMRALRDQVDQMRGMFSDDDGTIQEACDAHDETEEVIDKALRGDERLPGRPLSPASLRRDL